MSERGDDSFLSRWSRRKAQVRQGADVDLVPPPPQAEPLAAAPPVEPPPVAPGAAAAPEAPARVPPPPAPTMADVEALTPTSDFARFVAPGVDAQVKNSAMKKLFTDPHYNVMDGLDTYIEDYGRADPIPRSMLRQMVQARIMGLLDDELEEQPAPPTLAPAPAQRAEDPALQAAVPETGSPGAEDAAAAAAALLTAQSETTDTQPGPTQAA